MYLPKTPAIVKPLFKDLVFNIKTDQMVLYLTFDDGPHPTITPWVIKQLAKYNAKCTFFCVGDNIRKYPDAFNLLIENGHYIGNHTYNHLNGWKTINTAYIDNISKCQTLTRSNLFRPPYGKITKSQADCIKHKYKIIIWDVLSADFDIKVTPEKCLRNVVDNVEKGSIIVFHDSEKAEPRLKETLPQVLQHLTNLGYKFESLSNLPK